MMDKPSTILSCSRVSTEIITCRIMLNECDLVELYGVRLIYECCNHEGLAAFLFSNLIKMHCCSPLQHLY